MKFVRRELRTGLSDRLSIELIDFALLTQRNAHINVAVI